MLFDQTRQVCSCENVFLIEKMLTIRDYKGVDQLQKIQKEIKQDILNVTQPGKCHRQENLNGDSTGRTKKPTIIESKDKDQALGVEQ